MKKHETAKQQYPQDNYTLVEHLTELRSRLIYCIFAVGVFAIVGWIFSEQIFDYIRKPIEPYLPSGGLVFTALTDKFMAHVKVAVLTGIVAACPVWIFHIWRFVAPGLYSNEKKFGIIFIALGSLLFLVGISFAYFLVMPLACKELIYFGGTTDKPMITISEYMSFFMTTLLLFGAAFEMPLILNLLGIMGIVTSRGLRHVRRYAIVGISVVAAIFTPPDVMSMMLLGVPLCLLYEASIWILYFIEPAANKRQ
ncbi:MAG: twin-arginine translocase subunit TatC [Bdellovibrionales bacterium]|nr:twin-arginine translocase subunit TatC [Bdellovibrionales bacterium]